MKKILFFIKGLLLPSLYAISQPPLELKPLSIGDIVPEIVFNNIMNYRTQTACLSDFKGKLIILDFWSSWCGACISLFPHIDSLQKQFGNDIQIILVNTKSKQTKDDDTKIRKTLERVKARTGSKIDIPVVYNCEELDAYFPCIAIPHEVWIGKDGKVKGITSAKELMASNIQAMLGGKEISMPLKKDRSEVNIRNPLFLNGNGGDGTETMFRSLVTGELDGVSGGTGLRMEEDVIVGLFAVNQSLLSIIRTGYSSELHHENNRLIFDQPDKYKQIYCYEVMLPPTTKADLHKYIQHDLYRYFKISIKKEKRKVKCLVLKSNGKIKPSTSDRNRNLDIESGTLKKYIHNYSPSFVVGLLNNYSAIPILDETNISTSISVDLPFSLTDMPGLAKAFAKIGLQLREEEKEIEMVLISSR